MNGAEKYCPEHFSKEERLIVKSHKWQTVQYIHVLYQIYQAYSNQHTFKGNLKMTLRISKGKDDRK